MTQMVLHPGVCPRIKGNPFPSSFTIGSDVEEECSLKLDYYEGHTLFDNTGLLSISRVPLGQADSVRPPLRFRITTPYRDGPPVGV